ncbi:hypothetical protein HDC90_004291 [Pedobacter sp. AK013]|uniref:glycoside hydrolase family 5 protein n=1 Tax=Pedobacter sp. AK013 TaxID=2723071 RepID=UPI001617529C|nr:glycoside hydrolase family 5 protein [Pedobacter sp. AK013]MBB6239633.1 hypothetical protein [Pedobacter sp. AK013]
MNQTIFIRKLPAFTLLVIFLMLVHLKGYAQDRLITGKIAANEDSSPLSGATVLLKGRNKSTVTNEQGLFSILAKKGDVLIFRMVGFKPQEITVEDANIINVVLKGERTNLDDVVVIGYAKIARKDATGSIGSISGEELRQTQPTTFDQALQGKVAGVVVQQVSGQPGGGVSIQIRGVSSIIYNTLDAPGWETGWGQPPVTQQLIDLVKSTGMNAIRIPCTWSTHIINKQTQEIDPLWLARVKEVVQYCFNAKMYVILNTHHDGYIDCKVTGAKQDTVNAKHKAIWQQIATTMRDFDEHLIFASANEPDATTDQETAALMRYHQSFIDAVRATGGKNAYRALVLQAPNTSITLMNEQLNPANVYKRATLPTDPVPQKMILEFHYYSPPNFCIISEDASWGKAWYFWGSGFHTTNPLFLDRNSSPSSEEASVDAAMRSVKTNFTDKGIPVIMGEYDVSYHADKLKGYPADSLLALKSGWHFYAYVTKQAKVNGIVPFLWSSAIFQRPFKNGVTAPAYIGDQVALDSLKKGAGF